MPFFHKCLKTTAAGLIFTFSSVFACAAQDEKAPEYKTEFSYGALFHSNGGLPGGGMIKFARAVNAKSYHHFRLEVANIKHPKEVKQRQGFTYYWGKQNSLFVLRPMYGREFVLFKKAPKQGAQVNFIAAAGPALAFVAPYIIQYEGAGGIIRTEQYNPAIHTNPSQVRGTGSFTERFSQASIQPGLSVKSCISVEFGAFKNSISGFEGGFVIDAYPKSITLYPSVSGNKIFTGIYVAIYYGAKR